MFTNRPAYNRFASMGSLCLALVAISVLGPTIQVLAQSSQANIQEKKKETMQNVTKASSRVHFGKTKDGDDVDLITLLNASGAEARIITYGATLIGMDVPDKKGQMANVVLGFDNVSDYETKSPYFGATVGRCANRIAKGEFELDGKTYKLAINNGPNTLHGGLKGFDKYVWEVVGFNDSWSEVTFKILSKDMDEGFPGNLKVQVTYALSESNELKITYSAETDKATPVNLTNHAYFNLAGSGQGTILSHTLTLNCSSYTPVDKDLIPTGKIAPVAGTAVDFSRSHTIGGRLDSLDGGYDHNFVIARSGPGLASAALALDSISGRGLEMSTTEPGVQFYTGNFLDGTIYGVGGKYEKHSAFCLEAQHYPDSVNQPNFPSIILRPGEKYGQVTVYKFTVH